MIESNCLYTIMVDSRTSVNDEGEFITLTTTMMIPGKIMKIIFPRLVHVISEHEITNDGEITREWDKVRYKCPICGENDIDIYFDKHGEWDCWHGSSRTKEIDPTVESICEKCRYPLPCDLCKRRGTKECSSIYNRDARGVYRNNTCNDFVSIFDDKNEKEKNISFQG